MEPSVWGPHAWFFLHTVTFTYPKEPTELDKRHMYDFFMKLQYILPCEMCKKHYQEHLYTMPLAPHLESRKSLVLWLIRFHNKVNVSLGKPQKSSQEILLEFSQNYKKTTKKSRTTMTIRWVIIFIIASVLGYYGYKYWKKKFSNNTPFVLSSKKYGSRRIFKVANSESGNNNRFKLFSLKLPELQLPKLLKRT